MLPAAAPRVAVSRAAIGRPRRDSHFFSEPAAASPPDWSDPDPDPHLGCHWPDARETRVTEIFF